MPRLRSEVDPAPLMEFQSGFYRQWRGAVSPDGRKLAYWHDGATAGWELRILETSALDRPRTVLQLRDELPEGLLWSGDQGGLVFGVSDKLTGQGVIGQYTALRTLDLATGNVTELARDKKWFHALAWDRKAGSSRRRRLPPTGPP